MIKVHISPDFIGSSETGGIRRVVEAMLKYFPLWNIEHTRVVSEADVIINHGAMTTTHKSIPSLHVGHGMYWSRQAWGEGYQEVNAKVAESMRIAVAHTAPSEWVSRALRRGGLWYPEVVYHGVDHMDFWAGENGNYVLWNKARADYVSDPNDIMRVSTFLPKVQFKTTIGKQTPNVEVLMAHPNKPIPFEGMKQIVSNAGVYLCTARETFGIGTLEALACGVPVAGWDWGGQSEIIIPGVTGYLAPPGDFKALAECIQLCLKERERLSANAIDDVQKRWGWKPRIEQYARIIERIYHDYHEVKRPKVSVIVTAYNLDRYLPKCLESVKAQTLADFECLVVDDAGQESTKYLVREFTRADSRIRYLPTPKNLGLPDARNFGSNHAKGRYIRHLDADDWLAENALALEAEALDKEPDVHIVYGHLEVVKEDGARYIDKRGNVERSGWPEVQFSWFAQMAHLNQLPSCSMMRREVLERSGGYRGRMKRAEDAEFWCRITSLGFRAKKITQAVTYFHRNRENSKGALEWKESGKEPDWTAWFPWRMGAGDYPEGKQVMRKSAGRHPNPHLVPFGAQGTPQATKFWYVHDYAYPLVSVIVTCGPYHEQHLLDALDSVQAQTYPDWECIVVNDTGKKWESDIMGAPFARVINMEDNQGVAQARNKGFEYARGRLIVWLDADDYWLPWYLERMVAYAEINDGVIFSDMIQEKESSLEIYRYPEFESERVPNGMRYAGSSILVPRKIVETVLENQGGWDTKIPGMEDWDYQIAVHDAGFCAYHLPEALFVYRVYSSTKRERDYAKIEEIKQYVDKKWKVYRTGEKTMGCGCGKPAIAKAKPASTLKSSGNFTNANQFVKEDLNKEELVQVEYMGANEGKFSISSRVLPGKAYRFGNNPHNKVNTVFLRDAEFLVARTDRNGNPEYRMVTGGTVETRDPSAVLGRALAG